MREGRAQVDNRERGAADLGPDIALVPARRLGPRPRLLLMLATVVEGRLMGINPYGQPGVQAYKRHLENLLKA